MTTVFRLTPKSPARISSGVLFAVGLMAVSGCTPTSGPDASVATYGIVSANQQNVLLIENATAPDQAQGVFVGTGNVGAGNVGAGGLPSSPLGIAETQGFAPGSAPPSAVMQELASATAFNPNAGAVTNSSQYVTDGVVQQTGVQPVGQAVPAPLTPADLSGQVPTPVSAPVAVATEVAALQAISATDANAALAIPDPVVTQKSARPIAPAKPNLFASLFGNKPKKTQQVLTASPQEDGTRVELASLDASNNGSSGQIQSLESLPGVNAKNLFALDPSANDNDENGYEEEPPVQLASASAAGLARLAPNGILKQTDRVDVACFKPKLISVLKKIEGHYGKKVIVTSGYRSPGGNRRAGGSRHSLHMMCSAADIQIAGVGKWELAKYLRSLPDRGGVGTYCYTDSVHVDTGSERDWNWRCRRR